MFAYTHACSHLIVTIYDFNVYNKGIIYLYLPSRLHGCCCERCIAFRGKQLRSYNLLYTYRATYFSCSNSLYRPTNINKTKHSYNYAYI